MKVSIFFLIKNSMGEYLESPLFYAYSDDKDMIESFRDTRDMNSFHEEIKEISKNDFLQFSKTYAKYRLIKGSFITKGGNEYIRKQIVSMTVTSNEEQTVYLKQESIFLMIANKAFDISIFKSKYIKDICKFDYPTFFKYQLTSYGAPLEFISNDMSNNINFDQYYNDFHVDTFSIFMDLYGTTIKE